MIEFLVIECMRTVVSTYHQATKFPTPNDVGKARYDLEISKNFYLLPKQQYVRKL